LLRDLQNRIANTPGANLSWLVKNELPPVDNQALQETGTAVVGMPRDEGVFVRFSQTPAVKSVYETGPSRPLLSPQELLNQAWPLQQLRPDEAYYRSLQPENPGTLKPWQAKNLRKQELSAIRAATQAGVPLPFQPTQEPLILTRLLSNQSPTVVDTQQFTVSTPNALRVSAPPPSLGIPYAQLQPWTEGPTGLTEIRGAGTPPDLLTPQAQAYPLSPSAQARATLGNTNFSRFNTYNVNPSDPLKVLKDYQSGLNAIMEAGETQSKPMASQQNQQNTPVVQVPREIITQPASGQVIQYASPVQYSNTLQPSWTRGMYFNYGQNDPAMAEGYRSTWDAIVGGRRSATTIIPSWSGYNQALALQPGNYVEFNRGVNRSGLSVKPTDPAAVRRERMIAEVLDNDMAKRQRDAGLVSGATYLITPPMAQNPQYRQGFSQLEGWSPAMLDDLVRKAAGANPAQFRYRMISPPRPY
jgi:hypothetical protein